LWQLNSALLLLLFLIVICSYFFLKKQIPTTPRIIPHSTRGMEEKVEQPFDPSTIYINDLFDTYLTPQVEEEPTDMVPLLPQPKFPKPQVPPLGKKIELLPPLPITLHGILSSSQKDNNVALIEDETLAEQSYYVGDQIKDAQVIQILKDSVTLIRANGQYETLNLKRDELISKDEQSPIETIVKKSDDGATILVDHENLKLKVNSLGQVADELSLATAYRQGIPLGLQIGIVPSQSLYAQFGLMGGDILTSLNSFSLAKQKTRYQAYQSLQEIKYGDTVTLTLLRKNTPFTLVYSMTRLQAPSIIGTPPKQFDGGFTLSKQQQRAENERQFAKAHEQERETTFELMRQRLLENMKNREPNMRSR
jgi:type II secretion system protein C